MVVLVLLVFAAVYFLLRFVVVFCFYLLFSLLPRLFVVLVLASCLIAWLGRMVGWCIFFELLSLLLCMFLFCLFCGWFVRLVLEGWWAGWLVCWIVGWWAVLLDVA